MTCKKCKETKELTEFNNDKSRPDGKHPYCKECRKKICKEHWEFKNPKQPNYCMDCNSDISHLNSQRLRCDSCKNFKELHRKRPQKDKDRARANCRLWRKNNPEKYKAQMKKQNDRRRKNNDIHS
jgi:hypothetical protein